MNSMYRTLLSALLVTAIGCKDKDERVACQPVSGKLMVQGKPAAGALIVLHPASTPDPRAFPRGRVEADGSFQLTTYVTNDGAPIGSYRVTIDWRTGETLQSDGVSQVPLPYTRLDSTPLKVEISAGTSELKPFEINK